MVQKGLLREAGVTSLLHFLFNWNSSRVVHRLRLVSVVVCLNQEPICFAQLVISMNCISVSLDNHSLVGTHSRDYKVYRTSNLLSPQLFCSCSICCFLSKYVSEQPKSRDGIFDQNANQIIRKMFGFSSITVHSKSAMSNTSQGEHATSNSINAVDFLVSFVVVNNSQQFRKNLPHFKIQISSMHHFTFCRSDQYSSAGLESRVLVHEVKEKYFLKRYIGQLRHGIHLGNEILMLVLIFGEPLHSIVKSLRNWKQINELNELMKG